MADCIFCKIGDGTIPSKKVYEDEDILIFNDITPQAKIHFLMIPKKHYTDVLDISENEPQLLAKMFNTLSKVAASLNLNNGFRVVTNKGDDGCQSVFHLHFHIIGGEKLSNKMA